MLQFVHDANAKATAVRGSIQVARRTDGHTRQGICSISASREAIGDTLRPLVLRVRQLENDARPADAGHLGCAVQVACFVERQPRGGIGPVLALRAKGVEDGLFPWSLRAGAELKDNARINTAGKSSSVQIARLIEDHACFRTGAVLGAGEPVQHSLLPCAARLRTQTKYGAATAVSASSAPAAFLSRAVEVSLPSNIKSPNGASP